MIDQRAFERIVSQAQRAPSVHNCQPARFRLADAMTIEVWGDPSRILTVGDPTRRDHLVSLGAAVEGVRLSLDRAGLTADVELLLKDAKDIPAGPDLHLAAKVKVTGRADRLDAMADLVDRRHAYRGIFGAMEQALAAKAAATLKTMPGAAVILDKNTVTQLAGAYDTANLQFMRDPKFAAELYHWLRLRRRHPDFDRDGLNADCMALSGPERMAASFLMRPGVLRVMLRTPFGPGIVSEAAKARSAAMVVVLVAGPDFHPMQLGAQFYRLWLSMTALDLVACPISSLVDDETTAANLKELLITLGQASKSSSVVAAWRCGALPAGKEARSPRLPLGEVIVRC